MSAPFILLASYPKSGNTWARIVFERLRRGVDFPLNKLDGAFHGVLRRALFDVIAPVNAADLLPDEMDMFLPDVLRVIAAESTEPNLMKVHDTARRTLAGDWLFPPEAIGTVIYLVRHPYDVAVSTAHHFGITIERAVKLTQDGLTMRHLYSWLPEPLPEYFGSWSENVLSWIDNPPYRVVVARYEDILLNPVAEFERLVQAAGLSATHEDVVRVVEASRFEELQQEEQRTGFIERPKTSPQFFREGRSGSWQGVLTPELRERLLQDHAVAMERLGYTADGGTVELLPL